MSCPSVFRRSSASDRLLRDCTCHHTEVPSFSKRHLHSGSVAAGACQRATGRFNLDDFRAKVGQGFGGKRPGNQLPEFKNFESGQRAGGMGQRICHVKGMNGIQCKHPAVPGESRQHSAVTS